jgi:nucleoside 2-deoxyribosyltransferase
MHPGWHEVFGSGGRAASAIANAGGKVTLHSCFDTRTLAVTSARGAFEHFQIVNHPVTISPSFNYYHPLSTPAITNKPTSENIIQVDENRVLRFGMLEGDVITHADQAVYDPQNSINPSWFHDNGSTTNHLAVVLNRREAKLLTNSTASPSTLVTIIAQKSKAEVVVLKMGPQGALVFHKNSCHQIPAYETDRIWKIGSGDNFAAHFALQWIENGTDPVDAANLASKATAYYCQNQGFPTSTALSSFTPNAIQPSEGYIKGDQRMVYLAGPFFSLAQLWQIEQARENLIDMGLAVFSPYHDVGHGSASDVVHLDIAAIHSCAVVLAIADGMDPGTVFEVGYARSIGKPVILYSENETSSNKKMMQGSGCILCDDYTTSIYKTLWAASQL